MRENTGIHATGMIQDTIRYSDGRVVVLPEDHNLVVNTFINVLTALLKGTDTGSKYWAIGSGSTSWDTTPVNPSPSDQTLVNEIARKAIPQSAISFIDTNGNVSSTPTSKISITLIFNEGDCNGAWREFGIVCGDLATTAPNTGVLMNKKHHAVITKTSDMTIERHMVFTFALS